MIMPYFGRWPTYFELYLQSCEINSWIDFLFFTDIQIRPNSPKNIKYIDFSLHKINSLAEEKIGIRTNVIAPYKLCDLRPAFGQIFKDYIKNYEFWGHGDIDLIYGRIGDYITTEILDENDIISPRKEYLSGPFCLYRNSDLVNELYLRSPDHPEVFTNNQRYSFGECNFQWDELKKGNSVFDIDSDIVHMTYLAKKAISDGELKGYFKTFIKESIEPGVKVYWDNGRVYTNRGEEYLLYHFISEKKLSTFSYPSWDGKKFNQYMITRSGFYPQNKSQGPIFWIVNATRRLKGLIIEIGNLIKKFHEKLTRN